MDVNTFLCANVPDGSGFSQDLLPHADTFMFCGEVLPVSVAKALLERFPKAKIFNTYGPTEATVAVTSVEITDDVISRSESLPVLRQTRYEHFHYG